MILVAHFRIFAAVLAAIGLFGFAGEAQERRVVVEDIPSLENLYRVPASNTHSGLPVPRFVSLKYSRVNGRQGPSLKHPVLWQYQRKGMPVIVVAEMDIWRKVRDIHGDESWVRGNSLSGTKSIIVQKEITLRRRPNPDARIVAIADPNVLMQLDECNDTGWCRIYSRQGHKGWSLRADLWGAGPL